MDAIKVRTNHRKQTSTARERAANRDKDSLLVYIGTDHGPIAFELQQHTLASPAVRRMAARWRGKPPPSTLPLPEARR